jgi:uncharacterized protein HemX
VAQTEIERLNAERAELGATIRRLEADKAAAEAKAHTFETTVYGAIIVLLLVAAGIGAFVLVVKQKQGQAGDHSSVTLETKKSSAAKPTRTLAATTVSLPFAPPPTFSTTFPLLLMNTSSPTSTASATEIFALC